MTISLERYFFLIAIKLAPRREDEMCAAWNGFHCISGCNGKRKFASPYIIYEGIKTAVKSIGLLLIEMLQTRFLSPFYKLSLGTH
jgi:hypothetical protein